MYYNETARTIKHMMIIDGIDISPLLKAQKKFELFRKHLETEQEKAGAIQAFEYTMNKPGKP